MQQTRLISGNPIDLLTIKPVLPPQQLHKLPRQIRIRILPRLDIIHAFSTPLRFPTRRLQRFLDQEDDGISEVFDVDITPHIRPLANHECLPPLLRRGQEPGQLLTLGLERAIAVAADCWGEDEGCAYAAGFTFAKDDLVRDGVEMGGVERGDFGEVGHIIVDAWCELARAVGDVDEGGGPGELDKGPFGASKGEAVKYGLQDGFVVAVGHFCGVVRILYGDLSGKYIRMTTSAFDDSSTKISCDSRVPSTVFTVGHRAVTFSACSLVRTSPTIW